VPDAPDLSDHTASTASTAASASPHDATEQPPEQEVEGAVPPGYDWPTHGGYLGCLVGTLAACPIVGFIAANVWALFHASRLAFPLFLLLIAVSLVAIVGAGRLGWRLGRRFYRYYPQPRPTWGETDETGEEGAVPPAAAAATDEAMSEGATDEDTMDEGEAGDQRTGIATAPDDVHG
jgi:hypothetical protein